jgi:hypothetical protein
MGGKAVLSGVRPKGKNGVELDFSFQGKRYRPTIARVPNEANLRRAHKQLLADSGRLRSVRASALSIFASRWPDGTLAQFQASIKKQATRTLLHTDTHIDWRNRANPFIPTTQRVSETATYVRQNRCGCGTGRSFVFCGGANFITDARHPADSMGQPPSVAVH